MTIYSGVQIIEPWPSGWGTQFLILNSNSSLKANESHLGGSIVNSVSNPSKL